MKISRVFLVGLMITTQFVLLSSDHSVYYNELKALKENKTTQGLFQEDLDGGSYTTQCNIEMYKYGSIETEDTAFFSWLDQERRALSLGNIQRHILMNKELSLFKLLLQAGLSDAFADLLIVTPETMPTLYNYVESIAQQANIATPVVFVSLKKGFFKSFSRKILMFPGSIVIGQQLLHDVSDQELEALVAQEIGHIKYNHFNKQFLSKIAIGAVIALLCENNGTIMQNKLLKYFGVSALTSMLLGKLFERQVDAFASQVAHKSDGLIKFYQRLEERDAARAAEFDVISDMIVKNAKDISILPYVGLNLAYYMAKAEHCAVGLYNKFAYPSFQERIDAAQRYLEQQA